MSTFFTLQEAVTNLLQNSGIAGFKWGTQFGQGNPYYEVADAPVPLNPADGLEPQYVVFSIADSSVQTQFINQPPSAGSVYTETYELTVKVVAGADMIASLSSPYAVGSVLNFLDTCIGKPTLFNGASFDGVSFIRKGWGMHKADQRAPDGSFPWEAGGFYEVILEFPYPATHA